MGWVMSDWDGPDGPVFITGPAGSAHTIEVMAVDKAGHVTTESVTVTSSGAPNEPPTVAITAPSSDVACINASMAADGVMIEWSGSDPEGAELEYFFCLMRASGGGATAWYVGTDTHRLFTPVELDAMQGVITVSVTATDAAGGTATAARTFTVDTVAPSFTIDVKRPWTHEVDRATVAWNVSETCAVEGSLDGGGWFEIPGDAYEAGDDVVEGAHALKLRFTDAAGNSVESDDIAFTVDLEAPEVVFINRADEGWSASRSFTLQWAATSDAVSYQFRMEGGEWQNVTGQTRTVAVPSDGRYVFHVRAFDAVGRFGSASIAVNVDTVPPEIAITSPRNGSYLDSAAFTVTFAKSPDAAQIWVYLDGERRNGPDLEVADGPHIIKVLAYDLAGNIAEDSVEFIVDTSLKVVSIDPEDPGRGNGSLTNRKNVHLSWESENLTRAVVILDGGEPVNATGQSGLTLSGLEDGGHVVTVSLTYSSNKTANVTVTFTVDTAAPSWTLLEPGDGSRTTARGIALRWECGADAVAMEIRLDDGDWVKVDASVREHVLDGLSVGPHTVNMRAYDAAGNFEQKAVTFIVEERKALLSEPVDWFFIIWALLLALMIAAMVISRHGPEPTATSGAAPPPASSSPPPAYGVPMDDVGADDVVDELIDDILGTDYLDDMGDD